MATRRTCRGVLECLKCGHDKDLQRCVGVSEVSEVWP